VLPVTPADLFLLSRERGKSELIGDVKDLRRKADDLPANATDDEKAAITAKMASYTEQVAELVLEDLAVTVTRADVYDTQSPLVCTAKLAGAAARTPQRTPQRTPR